MSVLSDAFKPADAQRIRVTAEQSRLDRLGEIEQAQRKLELDVQRKRAGIQLDREQRRAKAELRAEKRQAWAERTQRARDTIQAIGRRVLIAGPILAPMTVAWVGQIGFARGTLAWPLVGALVFAASWELTTAFAGWMYHQARQAGDRGSVFRAATWLFAAAAGAMNYWHALDGGPVANPTPKAVAYGAMSLAGIALWELYASLIHRQGMRAKGALPPARPRFGLARWLRFPPTTFQAWSLAIRDGIETTEEAWARAVQNRTVKPNPAVQVQVQREACEPEPAWRAIPGSDDLNEDAELEPDDESEPSDLNRVNLNPEPEVQVSEPEPANRPVRQAAEPEPRTANASDLGVHAATKAEQVQRVLNLMDELGDEAVTTPVVQQVLNLKRTTAYSRLVEARKRRGSAA